MISLTCTHCQTVLSIDDAFAGGVCRCQHCGTIQTVPSHLKAGATVKAGVSESASVSSGAKTLYQSQRAAGKARAEETGSGTGLEDLADVVASSGLGGSGLSTSIKPRKSHRRAVSTAAVPAPVSRPPLLLAVGTLLVLVVGLAAWWLLASNAKEQKTASPQANNDVVVAPTGPQFCGMPISATSLVYLLDRGDSAKEAFDAMKEATYKSIQSLGPDRKFQVLLWDNGTTDAGYPSGSTTFATPENLDACRKSLEDVTPQHQSTIQSPLKRAVAEDPDGILIVTAKGFELDDSFTSDVQSILKTNPIKLYTVSIQNEGQADCRPLQTLAKQTGGAYKSLSAGAMKASIGG